MKPYQHVPIQEGGDPLVPVPLDCFAVVSPHPYQALGAPYGDKSPFFLRRGVLDRLILAQENLQERCSGWRLQIFDAYRPIAVQQFMVDHTLAETARSQTFDPENLTSDQRQTLLEQVYQFWAPPSLDPATPPPHSTGAAIDLTLVDTANQPVNMGSPIDELSPRSYPNHFAHCSRGPEQTYHKHRQLLCEVMYAAGFQRHPQEWWHFSFGDQLWAWLTNQRNPESRAIARYGRVETLAPVGCAAQSQDL